MAALTPGSEFGGHRIEAVIASGGMGVVYRATHLTLELPVALKVISPDLAGDVTFRERFRREARVAASIDNPHVIPVRDAGEADGLLYISMRLIDGPTVGRLVTLAGGLGAEAAVDLTEQIAEGLDAAHRAGLVHRDVKPANVLVEGFPERSHAFLTDFGITRRQTVADDLTLTGKFVGSIDYVAPEQIRGEPVDERCDVYALAGVLSFMLTGSPPFPRDNSAATIYAHLNEAPPVLPPSVSGAAALNAVIAKGMAKEAGERFDSPGDLARAARAALEGAPTDRLASAAPGKGSDGTTSEQPSPPPRGRPAPKPAAGPRRRLIALVGGLVGLAIIGIAALALGGGGGGGGGGQSFIAKANAICTGMESQVQQAYDRAGGEMITGSAATGVLAERASIVGDGAVALSKLEPPTAKETKFKAYRTARAEFASEMKAFGAAREAGDAGATAAAAAKLKSLDNEKIALGRRLGLDACGERLPPDDVKAVDGLATKWVNGEDSSTICSKSVSETFLGTTYSGNVVDCENRSPDLPGARPVSTTGITNVHAVVDVEDGAGGAGSVLFVHKGGDWEIDGFKSGGSS